jgi:hypothetical protein
MGCEVPNWLFLKASEWNEWKEYNKKKDGWKRFRNAGSRYLGICDSERGVIAIFVKKFISLDAIDRTIRHELAHWVRSYNHRGTDFARIMDEIKKGKLKANRRGFSPRKLAPLGIAIALLFSAPCFAFTNSQIVDAIYLAEGGARAKYPYGIRSVKCEGKSECRKVCENTIKKNRVRYAKYGHRQYSDFIDFVGSRYCPTKGRNLSKAERNLNGNWSKNVKYFLTRRVK